MPNGSRVIANNAYGATSDNPLTIGATTLNSIQLQLLPDISSPTQHAVIVLDPKRVNGEPEIIIVTDHTGLSTEATIIRAAYGTTARAHPMGSAWVHIEVDEDYIEILTSTTRPTDPYLGQFIFETNTLSHRFYDGSVWSSVPAIGTLLMFAGPTAPTGYLFANGTAVSRTGATADLFAVIGTTYGIGDGATTFNLPNLNGRVPVGRNVSEAEFDVLGELGGEKNVVLDSSKMPSHNHPTTGIFGDGHRHAENSHRHDVQNLPLVGDFGNHVHGGSTGGAGTHDHQTNVSSVMVIAAGAGPFNVSPPGGDFVTFDVGGTARTSGVGNHGHSTSVTNSGNLFQAVKTNSNPAVTNITATNNNACNDRPDLPGTICAPSFTPTHNNIQPYITVNYIIKI